MKTILTTAAVALAAAGAANAMRPADLAQETKTFYNKRFALSGAPFRITTVQCIRESPTSYYCVGHVTIPGYKYAWNVTVAPDGMIHWAQPVVLTSTR